jgi:two-component system response regulator HydG
MKQKTLLVEDDLVYCKLLTRFLSKNDFEVMDAQNGKDAMELMAWNNFDLAVLDYRLPDLNGLDLLKKLKINNPFCKVILITRYGDEDVANQAIAHGIDAFITKPINPTDLLQVIKKL